MDAQTILILGGGVGGLVAARELRRRLPRSHRIVLVEREADHVFAPSLLWLMTGARRPEAIRRPLQRIERRGVELLRGEVSGLDPVQRTAIIDGRPVRADFVIVALGAELAPESVPGLPESGHNLYTSAGAESLRDALGALQTGRVAVLTASPVYKCPAAPYEAAMLIDDFFRRAGRRGSVQLSLYAAEAAPMATAGPDISAGLRAMLAEKQIEYRPEHQVTSVVGTLRRLEFGNGASADFDLLAFVPPHRAPRVVRESPLASPSGWIAVDRTTMETSFPGVFALGDVATIPLAMGKPLPKAGVFAHAQAEVVARNIVRQITGRGEPARFDGHGACFVETGAGRAAYGDGDFYAEPVPDVKMRPPSRRGHWGKVLFEKSWLMGHP